MSPSLVAIPDPGPNFDSSVPTLMALKEAVETLQGLRGGAGVAGGQQIIQVVGGGGGGDEPAAGIYDLSLIHI